MAFCRICLKTEENMSLLFGFDQKSGISLFSMLKQCVDIEVIIKHNFPDQICLYCKELLIQSFWFIKLVKESNEKLIIKHSNEINRRFQFSDFAELKNKLDVHKFSLNKKNDDIKSSLLTSNILIEGGVISNTEIKKLSKDESKNNRNYNNQNSAKNYDDLIIFFCKGNRKEVCTDKYLKKKKPIKVIARIKKYDGIIFEDDGCARNKETIEHKKVAFKIKPKTFSPRREIYMARSNLFRNLNKAFNSSLRKAKERNKILSEEKSLCPMCGILVLNLSHHLRTHNAKTQHFDCKECNKRYLVKSRLIMHMKVHTGVKDQICEICGKGYFYKHQLMRHALGHAEVKPFPCDICSKKFTTKQTLSMHLRIHTGQKPFKCDECSMAFTLKQHMITHTRIHTGEKPYMCEVCNLAFTYKVNLNKHVSKIHGINLKFKTIKKFTLKILKELIETENIQFQKEFTKDLMQRRI